jgi:hypothetical protein
MKNLHFFIMKIEDADSGILKDTSVHWFTFLFCFFFMPWRYIPGRADWYNYYLVKKKGSFKDLFLNYLRENKFPFRRFFKR